MLSRMQWSNVASTLRRAFVAPGRALSLGVGGLALLCAGGCTETPYAFFDAGFGGNSGSSCSGDDCEESPGSGGENAGTGGAASDPCQVSSASGTEPTLTAVRLQMSGTELCLASGAASILVTDPIFLTTLVKCSSAPTELWTLRTAGPDAVEVRNEHTDFNLDVEFAATDDGTPFILFKPHQLYNQRYYQRPVDGGFVLSPWHAPTKCLTNDQGQLELWPCDPLNRQQTFATLSCAN